MICIRRSGSTEHVVIRRTHRAIKISNKLVDCVDFSSDDLVGTISVITMQLAARLQRPAFAGSIRSQKRALIVCVAQSDTPSDDAPAPRAPPLQSLELDAARPPQRPAISSLVTPHNVLLINGRLAMM